MITQKVFRTIGFHGTSFASAKQILREGFQVTQDPEAWLGLGVYFFIDGILSGHTMAADWAKFRNPHQTPCVLECAIECPISEVLDLRKQENMRMYNDARLMYVEKHFNTLSCRRNLNVKKRKDIRLDDTIISQEIMKILKKIF